MDAIQLDRHKMLSEQIPLDDIKQWIETYKQGEQVIVKIGCSTGMGKTYFINNSVSSFLDPEDLHLLYLSPRIELNKQQVNDTDDLDCVDRYNIHTTQSLQMLLIESEDYIREFQVENHLQKEHLPLYDIIVVDEAHLLINDTVFNQESLLVLNWLRAQNKLIIFLSGTGCNLFKTELSPTEIKYKCDDDYSMVNKVVIAHNDKQLVKELERTYNNLEDNEKILVVTEKIFKQDQLTELAKWAKALPDHKVGFIYSNSSPSQTKFKDFQRGEIKNGTFDTTVLVGTKVIAEGVNITDTNCKILAQNFFDEDTHLQVNGRLRNREGITLIVRAYNNNELGGKLRSLKHSYGCALDCWNNSKLLPIARNRFQNKMTLPKGFYRKYNGEIDLIESELIFVVDLIWQYERALEHPYGHLGVLQEMYLDLKVPRNRIVDLDEVEVHLSNTELIEFFEENKDVRFVTDEQQEELIKLCNCRDKQHRLLRTPKSINRVLADEGINWMIKSKQTSKRVNGRKVTIRYWIVEEVIK